MKPKWCHRASILGSIESCGAEQSSSLMTGQGFVSSELVTDNWP